MKRLLMMPLSGLLIAAGDTVAAPSLNCTLNGIRFSGNVQVVTSFPDLKVKVVESFPDECGEWRFVESFPGLP